MLRLKKLERGDTIIEVMVALSVLGLAFAISYATANHALQVSQNAQEHSQALQILDSQVDQARAISSNPDLYNADGSWFCNWIDSSGGQTEIKIQRYSNNNVQNAASEASDCQVYLNGQTNYTIYDSYAKDTDANDVDQNIFTFTATWPGVGTLGQQQEQISYKLHETADTSSGVGAPTATCPAGETGTFPHCVPTASLQVSVKMIAPDPGNSTPSCSEAATQNIAGSNVNLSSGGTNITQQTTGSDSSTVFNDLNVGQSYTANVTSTPSGYSVCAPSSGSNTAVSSTLNTINLKIYPVCTSVYQQTGSTLRYGVVGYQSNYVLQYGITGYQSNYVLQYGVVGYQYNPIYTYGITGYQWVPVWTYGIISYGSGGAIYGWQITGYNYEPIYGYYISGYQQVPIYGYYYVLQQVPIYGYYYVLQQVPIYGYYYIPVYGYVSHCPS